MRERDVRATDDEIREAALQFVRKISGFRRPSGTNEAAFEAAVSEISSASRRLLSSITDPDKEPAPVRPRKRSLDGRDQR